MAAGESSQSETHVVDPENLIPKMQALKVPYDAKLTFEQFSINKRHHRPFYNLSWYEKSLSSPSFAFFFFIKCVLEIGSLEFSHLNSPELATSFMFLYKSWAPVLLYSLDCPCWIVLTVSPAL